MKHTTDDKQIFAKTLFNEAGSTCDIFELIYVGWVIRNRVEAKNKFRDSFAGVCLQSKQFSCWNKKSKAQILKLKYNNNFRFTICMMVAEYIIDVRSKDNPIPGVCYYYEPTLCSPRWARKMKRVYTDLHLKHIFFKEK